MAANLKKTTAIAGLKVVRNPHQMLNMFHNKILRAIENMPKESAYRRHTEQIITQRQMAVNSIQSVEELEQKINGGQVEEMIQQARKELTLARNMLQWKPWEPLQQDAPHNQWKWPL